MTLAVHSNHVFLRDLKPGDLIIGRDDRFFIVLNNDREERLYRALFISGNVSTKRRYDFDSRFLNTTVISCRVG